MNEPEVVAYLALQIGIFQPRNILFLGDDEVAHKILVRATKGLNWEVPIFTLQYSSDFMIDKNGRNTVQKLRNGFAFHPKITTRSNRRKIGFFHVSKVRKATYGKSTRR